MRALYARALTEEERNQLRRSLKSGNGFTVRRAQMILKSSDEGLKVDDIAEQLACSGQTVREAIHAFEREGLNFLEAKKMRRKDDQRAFDEEAREALRELIPDELRRRICNYFDTVPLFNTFKALARAFGNS